MFGLSVAEAVLLLVLLAYGCPSFIAAVRGHHQRMAIIALNLLLGWTILGWIAALIWALTATPSMNAIPRTSPTEHH